MMRKHLYLENGELNSELLIRPIIVYGCGNDGMKLVDKLENTQGKIRALCDSDERKWGSSIRGYRVICPDELTNYKECNVALAFFRWPEVIDRLDINSEQCFVDYPYYEEVSSSCIICGNKSLDAARAHFAPFIVEKMFHGNAQKTRFLKCRSCGMGFSEYRPTDDEMDCLYSDYRGSEYLRIRTQYEKNYMEEEYSKKYVEERRKQALESFLTQYMKLAEINHVLDYGGDEGQYIPDGFINAEKYVYEISGYQLRTGVRRIDQFDEISHYSWDFIMCCHVLEHVSDPRSIIDVLVHSLSEDGYLYIEVPYETFMYSYHDIEINEHISYFTKGSLKEIAKLFGLEICCIQSFASSLIALYQKRRPEQLN
ncbi:MAG: class I SAM-dependent methyltransferase [bacterium]|nr:class I SAM-dependent methyltransferase [bacterium]